MIGDYLTIFDRDHILVLYKIDTPGWRLVQNIKNAAEKHAIFELGSKLL
jgi:hypothetical protein